MWKNFPRADAHTLMAPLTKRGQEDIPLTLSQGDIFLLTHKIDGKIERSHHRGKIFVKFIHKLLEL